jgi:hypothetical protein
MAYGKRKKGGQRLMEMSRAGAKRKAARKAKTLAQAKANIAKGPVTRGGAKKKVAPAKAAPTKVAAKSTAAGRNRTALRMPRGAGSVAKPAAKRKSSGPAPLPKNIQGMARPTLSDLPGNILKGSAIAFPGSIAVRGIGKKAIESGLKTEAGKKLMKSLTNVFKRKPKPAPKPAPKPKPKPKKKKKPESAFKNTPNTKTQRRYPGGK